MYKCTRDCSAALDYPMDWGFYLIGHLQEVLAVMQ